MIDVVGGYVSPSGFIEKPLDIPPLHIASVTSDFDTDGLLEIVGSPLNLENGTNTDLQSAISGSL